MGTKNVSPYAFDVADCALLEKNIHSFSGQNTGIDIMIANAGITYYTPFLSSTIEAFDRLVAVNLRGSYFSAQYAAKEMIKHKKAGRIILMSSINGHRVIINLSIYGATKAGIRMIAKNLGLELGPHNITVNAISPGATRTERTVKDDPEFDKNWSGVTPTGNKIMVEDVVCSRFLSRFTGSKTIYRTNYAGRWRLDSSESTASSPSEGTRFFLKIKVKFYCTPNIIPGKVMDVDLDTIRKKLYSAVISDILDDMGFTEQVMDITIRPLREDDVLVGPARTLLAVPDYSIPEKPLRCADRCNRSAGSG